MPVTMVNLPIPVFDMVIFGATGDLAQRKLLPALYSRLSEMETPDGSRILAIGRQPISREEFIERARESCAKFVDKQAWKPEVFEQFAPMIDYVRVDLAEAETYKNLGKALKGREDVARVFYLSTSPDLFVQVSQHLKEAGLVTAKSRVVLEKPLGHDLASSREISAEVGKVFSENAIFRIDHYLGKEAVQNLMVLRFANPILERIWHRTDVSHVQITVAETVGVEGRAGYYDHSGALRDMVQNHLLQVLCLIAMEPPVSYDHDAVRDEKLKVLKALKPISGALVDEMVIRGQYTAGAINGKPVPGYLEELGPGAKSRTETFVALKAEIANWRWSGVPFYLRTGKRLPRRGSEIVIHFRKVPHDMFGAGGGDVRPNRLVIRLQPDEGLQLMMMTKMPTPGTFQLQETALNLLFTEAFKGRVPDAYERLLLDTVRGNPTLFMRRDEVDAAWTWIQPILDRWADRPDGPRPYVAGTWGPQGVHSLIERDGWEWNDL